MLVGLPYSGDPDHGLPCISRDGLRCLLLSHDESGGTLAVDTDLKFLEGPGDHPRVHDLLGRHLVELALRVGVGSDLLAEERSDLGGHLRLKVVRVLVLVRQNDLGIAIGGGPADALLEEAVA